MLDNICGFHVALVKLCWAQQVNKEATNQQEAQNKGTHKITVLRSRTTGWVFCCEMQEQVRKERRQEDKVIEGEIA